MRFRREMRRVFRFLLMIAAVYAVIALLGLAAAKWMMAQGVYEGKLPWAFRDSCTALSTLVLVWLNRRFTFVVTEPVGKPMLTLYVGGMLWRYVVENVLYTVGAPQMETARSVAAALLLTTWIVICYLLQRLVFYREALRRRDEDGAL